MARPVHAGAGVTFAGLLQAWVIITIVLWMVIFSRWPRHPDGRLYSLEEFEKWLALRSVREPPKVHGQMLYTGICIILATLAIALSPGDRLAAIAKPVAREHKSLQAEGGRDRGRPTRDRSGPSGLR